MHPCISIFWSIHPSVSLSIPVSPSVSPSVGDPFFEYKKSIFFNNWNPGKAIKRLEYIFRCIPATLYECVSRSVCQSCKIEWKSTFPNQSKLEGPNQSMSWIIKSWGYIVGLMGIVPFFPRGWWWPSGWWTQELSHRKSGWHTILYSSLSLAYLNFLSKNINFVFYKKKENNKMKRNQWIIHLYYVLWPLSKKAQMTYRLQQTFLFLQILRNTIAWSLCWFIFRMIVIGWSW